MCLMTETEFLLSIKKRVAQTCIGASAIRNQGEAGLIEPLRFYFQHGINLQTFFSAIEDEHQYSKYLNRHTTLVLKKLPVQSWGAARKGLNLFFRDVVYNKFLSNYYGLPNNFKGMNKAIHYLEVP